jgi:putative transposase
MPRMPRSARIDMPGYLQHVIVRGIERRDIFLDEDDKALFVDRFSKLLTTTETDCFAWTLLTNHFHLLLRPRTTKLSSFMRRLLTGYAVVFNHRHNRNGHLFQNRYKSIVCQEDAYLLELVRYIHLNPLRAGLVHSLNELDSYKWSGHSGILGHGQLEGQKTDDVLSMFSNKKKLALKQYGKFIADGVPLGKRDELVGGGLRRSLKLSGTEEHESYDERILGSGEFVEQIRKEFEMPEPEASPVTLEEIIKHIARIYKIDQTALRQGGKTKELCDARGVLCYLSVKKFGLNGAAIARKLNITRSGVLVAARRGEEIYEKMPELHDIHAKLTKSTTSP